MSARTKLAVLGSPIGHSLSPRLHAAAYGVLDLRWTYEAIEVQSGGLESFLRGLDDGWRGLSLTMPLKREALGLPLDFLHGDAHLTGSANTLLIEHGGISAENTDIHGITTALGSMPRPHTVQLVGSGATASSALLAVHRLGARRLHISARAPERATELVTLGAELGLVVTVGALGEPAPIVPDLIVSTLPGGAAEGLDFPAEVREHAVLFDVAYDPWPSALARQWSAVGGSVISGHEMLLHQAVAQIRLFVADDATLPLPDEPRVIAAMRAALSTPA